MMLHGDAAGCTRLTKTRRLEGGDEDAAAAHDDDDAVVMMTM